MERNESIIKKREALKLTQEQLGRMIGVKANTVSQYESGKRKPKGKVAKKLSVLLEIPLEEII